MTRSGRHLGLSLVVTAFCAAAWYVGDAAEATARLSLTTAWLCFALLAAALCIGPWRVLQGGQPTLNVLLRRDLGIWAAITALAHLLAATAVVMTPVYYGRYINGVDNQPLSNPVGQASIVGGYLIGIVCLVLLAASNNRALRTLGAPRWKKLQRWAYGIFALTVAHGLAFQYLEFRTGIWLLVLSLGSLAVLALQLAGRRAVLRRTQRG
jgi:sulfoxide reductase heme-binding subunit YedZ